MQVTAPTITPCLWFDTQAEDAAKFYASVFKDTKIGKTSRFGKEGFEVHGKKAGTVMTVEFEIGGQKFVALNAARTSTSTRRYHSRSTATPSRRSTTSGKS